MVIFFVLCQHTMAGLTLVLERCVFESGAFILPAWLLEVMGKTCVPVSDSSAAICTTDVSCCCSLGFLDKFTVETFMQIIERKQGAHLSLHVFCSKRSGVYQTLVHSMKFSADTTIKDEMTLFSYVFNSPNSIIII